MELGRYGQEGRGRGRSIAEMEEEELMSREGEEDK